MLLQFSVTNHRSIKDTAIISLKASTDKSLSDCLISPDEKKQLVPVLALYGANAAGKSNVLHALLLMREMVCGRPFRRSRLLSLTSPHSRPALKPSIFMAASSMPMGSRLTSPKS